MEFPNCQKSTLRFQCVCFQNTFDGLIVTSDVGRIELSLAYYIKSATLKASVLRCTNLRPSDQLGTANPCVKL